VKRLDTKSYVYQSPMRQLANMLF